MKKRLGSVVMLVCILAFGLVFVSCKSDDGGGMSIPSLSPFKATDLAGIGLTLSGNALTEATGKDVIEPIFKLLEDRYDKLAYLINDEILSREGYSSVSFTLDLSDYVDDTDLTDYGIENLAGTVKCSFTVSSSLESDSGTINLTHDYDSAHDSDSFDFIGANTVMAKVKAASKFVNSENGSYSGGKGVALSYAVAFNYGTNCGYAIVNVGWAYSEVYNAQNPHGKYTSGPTATVKIDLYAPDRSFIGTQSVSGADALDFLGFYD